MALVVQGARGEGGLRISAYQTDPKVSKGEGGPSVFRPVRGRTKVAARAAPGFSPVS